MIRSQISTAPLTALLILFCSPVLPGADPVSELTEWLSQHTLDDTALQQICSEPFSGVALSSQQADTAATLLWKARADFLKSDRRGEQEAGEIKIGDLRMPFWYRRFGEPDAAGARLFISMHGGGGAPARINDQQYENQKRLYQPPEGIYLVPRAPTNTWDLWHQSHIDTFFERLITNLTVLENVDPDRVYIMGYSAGGDGVYQLAPRMADRLAAAAMMAGHPNESRPEGLRNIGFTIHMGGDDAAYQRNERAADWQQKLAALQEADPEGYRHSVTIHPGMGHWMQLKDAVAVPWMSEFRRDPWPDKIVWVQDNVTHQRFYWLLNNSEQLLAGDRIDAAIEGSVITVSANREMKLTLMLHDRLLSLDEPVTVRGSDGSQNQFRVSRTMTALVSSLQQRDDPRAMAQATLDISVKAPSAAEN